MVQIYVEGYANGVGIDIPSEYDEVISILSELKLEPVLKYRNWIFIPMGICEFQVRHVDWLVTKGIYPDMSYTPNFNAAINFRYPSEDGDNHIKFTEGPEFNIIEFGDRVDRIRFSIKFLHDIEKLGYTVDWVGDIDCALAIKTNIGLEEFKSYLGSYPGYVKSRLKLTA